MVELDFMNEVLDELRPYVRERYHERGTVRVESKKDPQDLLTEVDLEVQRRIVARVREQFPDDFIVAEESGHHEQPENPNVRCWIIDPIDGTQNFVRGMYPTFGVSIAFAEGGKVVAGAVDFPMNPDRYCAARGQGTTRNGQPVHTTAETQVTHARIEIDFSGPEVREGTLRHGTQLIRKAGAIRCHCAAVVGLCAIASGDIDAYFCAELYPYDYAAGMIIVEEAGGTVTHLDGSPIAILGNRHDVAASNGPLHPDYLAVIAEG